ncbi:MAG: Fe-S protein assembly co-chaperone HscB [Gemmataceae bacterium]|nr:Fe-S protein assembly co-chaperone HscB [Gemmataceae bacterium]
MDEDTRVDMFERLGLPRRFSVDLEVLEREYLARSRSLHPDFHQLGAASEQAASLELSAALNEAYSTLKNPFRRAEYLLQVEGGPVASAVKNIPVEFLEEMLELRMEIAELERDSPEAAEMEKKMQVRCKALLEQVGQQFGLTDATRLLAIRKLLNATKYVENLLHDLRAL